jgi:hypothetical protein
MTDHLSLADPTAQIPVPHAALHPGERYRIVLTDCCAEGEFVAHFLGWDSPPGRDGERLPRALFAEGGALHGVAWLAYPA